MSRWSPGGVQPIKYNIRDFHVSDSWSPLTPGGSSGLYVEFMWTPCGLWTIIWLGYHQIKLYLESTWTPPNWPGVQWSPPEIGGQGKVLLWIEKTFPYPLVHVRPGLIPSCSVRVGLAMQASINSTSIKVVTRMALGEFLRFLHKSTGNMLTHGPICFVICSLPVIFANSYLEWTNKKPWSRSFQHSRHLPYL